MKVPNQNLVSQGFWDETHVLRFLKVSLVCPLSLLLLSIALKILDRERMQIKEISEVKHDLKARIKLL